MEFLNEYHLAGLFIGICTFLIIGLFHPVVVKAEYYWGTKCWWIFLILGIAGVAASLSIDNVILSSLLGVFAFSSFWTIKEVFEQEDRVKKDGSPRTRSANINSEQRKNRSFCTKNLHNSAKYTTFVTASSKWIHRAFSSVG